MKQKLIIIYIFIFITGGMFSISLVYIWNKSYTLYLWKQSILSGHPKDGFERSTPEAQRIPSTAILELIETKDKKAHQALAQKLDSLQIPPLSGNAFHPIKNDFSGIYTIENNNDIKEVAIDLTKDLCTLHIRTPLSTHTLPAGNGFWQGKHTDKNSPYYNASYRNPIGLAPFNVAGSYNWTATNQIKIKYLFTEDLSSETYRITFQKNRITITITENSEDPQKPPTILTGSRKIIN